MMSAMSRALKQILYGAFYIGIVFGTGYLIFFRVILPPSCTDGFKNQGETGIDCGGPCHSCDIKALSVPAVLRAVYFINQSERTIDLAAEIKNLNVSWGIRKFQYEFVLKSEDKELARVPGESFILPAERRWIIRPGGGGEFPLISLPAAGQVQKVEFEIKSIGAAEWQKLKPFASEVSVITKNPGFRKINPLQGFAELRGEIENRSSFYIDEVEVNGVLFDAGGEVLAAGKTIVWTLRPGESRFFSIKWPAPFPGTVARPEALGHSNLLLDLNFLKQFGE